MLSTGGREVVDCLRLNGLDVDVTDEGPLLVIEVARPDGPLLRKVRFGREHERRVLIELAVAHCSDGQWVRMAFYDGLPLRGGRR